MARTGLHEAGLFMPAATYYKRPGAWETALRGEAAKQARYLSEMDQFYAGLDQAQKQFEETMKWQKEKHEIDVELQKWMSRRETRTGMERLQKQLDLRGKELAWEREKYGREEAQKREVFDFYKDLLASEGERWKSSFKGMGIDPSSWSFGRGGSGRAESDYNYGDFELGESYTGGAPWEDWEDFRSHPFSF